MSSAYDMTGFPQFDTSYNGTSANSSYVDPNNSLMWFASIFHPTAVDMALSDRAWNMQSAFDAWKMGKEMDFNAAEAQKNRDWQERMSNTSYQRSAADLRAAGFNPALMLGSSGASVGSGASASVSGSGAPGYSGVRAQSGALPKLVSLALSAYNAASGAARAAAKQEAQSAYQAARLDLAERQLKLNERWMDLHRY